MAKARKMNMLVTCTYQNGRTVMKTPQRAKRCTLPAPGIRASRFGLFFIHSTPFFAQLEPKMEPFGAQHVPQNWPQKRDYFGTWEMS